MNCKEARQLMDGYLDGELDLVRSMDIEAHLEDCGSCLKALESRRALSKTIRSASLRFDAPQGLEKRILASIRKESKPNEEKPLSVRRQFFKPLTLAFGTAAVALLAVLGWNLLLFRTASVTQDLLVQEAVSNHVRSLQANHLFDVASTDQHTVKPWFNGKLDFSPPVTDLADRGFPLIGGRLDYLDCNPTAALVYRCRRHVINLFVWPCAKSGTEPPRELSAKSYRGYYIVHWSHGGMTFYAVSDVNSADLREFAQNVLERIGR